MNTLLMDVATWDLTIDGSKNIAMATGAYAIAQDVASAIRTFLGEVWYDTEQGVPYFQQILGQGLSRSFLENALNSAALSVPGVVQAKTVLNDLNVRSRVLTGTVFVIDTTGQELNVNF